MKYYEELAPPVRERLFAAMRDWDARSQRHYENARKLAAPWGTIAVGTADFDETIKAECIQSYLRQLRRGDTPLFAYKTAMAERTEIVKKHNLKRGNDYMTHRAETCEQTLIDTLHREILRAVA